MAFVSGVIAKIDGEIDEKHDSLSRQSHTGHELISIIDTQQESSKDYNYFSGTVANQKVVEVQNVKIDGERLSTQNPAFLRLGEYHGLEIYSNDEIEDSKYPDLPLKEENNEEPDVEMRMETEKRTDSFQIWGIDNEFIVIDTFEEGIWNTISEMADINIKPIKFKLKEILNDYPGLWMGSFDDRGENVTSGTLYGEEIDYDLALEIGENDINQIGPKIPFEGDVIKCRITEKGFVQIISPGDYDRKKHAEFVLECLLTYAKSAQ